MIIIDDVSLALYPKLIEFFSAQDKFDGIYFKNIFSYCYKVKLSNGAVPNESSTETSFLSLIELCALLGLDKHMAYLRQNKAFYEHVCHIENKALYYSIENGHLNVFKQLEVVFSRSEIIDRIQENNSAMFKTLINHNYHAFFVHVAKRLSHIEFIDLIEARNFDLFRLITKKLKFQFMNLLEDKLSKKEFNKGIQVYNFEAYHLASKNGSFELIDCFERYLSDAEIINAIKSQSFESFRLASQNGHLHLLEHFEAKLSELDVITAIKEHNFEDFCLAAENLHHDVVNAIKARYFESFRLAAEKGHLNVVRHIITKLSKDDVINAIQTRSFEAFRSAAQNGHLELLKYLELTCLKAGINIINAIQADKFESFSFDAFRFDAFRLASQNGHVELLCYFEEKFLNSGIDVCQAIMAYSFESFRLAAENGHLNVLKHFESKLKASNIKLTGPIEANAYYAYHFAAANGKLEILQFLESHLSEKRILEAIQSRRYYAYCYALRNGHIETLKHLENKLLVRGITLSEIMFQDAFKAFRYAALKNKTEVIYHCLNDVAVFSHSELRVQDYGDKYISPFIDRVLRDLYEQKARFETHNASKAFDVKNSDAPLFFYIIRYLIRRNEGVLIKDINLLIKLPSIRSLLPTNLSGDGENELLRLALKLGNKSAVNSLLSVPKILELSEKNNFYETVWGAYGALNLREIVFELNASIQLISDDEQRMVDLFHEKYEDEIADDDKLLFILNELEERLMDAYKEDPPIIDICTKKEIKLPATWEDFRNLMMFHKKDKDFQSIAIKAYYDHLVHTVLRCLSQEKSWLSEINKTMPDGNVYIEHWSTAEEYLPTIAHLYLAARERKIGKKDKDSGREKTALFLKLFSSLCGKQQA